MSHDVINIETEGAGEREEERKADHFRNQKSVKFSSWIGTCCGGCLGRNMILRFRVGSCVPVQSCVELRVPHVLVKSHLLCI